MAASNTDSPGRAMWRASYRSRGLVSSRARIAPERTRGGRYETEARRGDRRARRAAGRGGARGGPRTAVGARVPRPGDRPDRDDVPGHDGRGAVVDHLRLAARRLLHAVRRRGPAPADALLHGRARPARRAP